MTVNPVEPETRTAVDTILGLAKLPMSEEEYTALLALYPFLRERTAALRLPEVRYGEPVLIYSAAARALAHEVPA
jgi:hypothetical protein